MISRFAVSVLAILLTALPAGAVSAQSAVVTNSQDSGPGSLRAALVEAAAQPGVSITFDLPTSDAGYDAKSNDWTIRPVTALPALGTGTSLHAETQPGTRLSPRVVLDGTLLAAGEPLADGLTFTASGATARGLRIVRFPGHGVRLTADRAGVAANNTLRACIVGLDANGLAAPNSLGGVRLDQGAHHNLIGGPAPADRCVLSGNGGRGLLLTGAGTTGNTLGGCYVGTDESGTMARPNALEGVAIMEGSNANFIGARGPGGGNVISGSNSAGVVIAGVGANENVLVGNAIGTNAARTAALPNQGAGVAIHGGAKLNLVGYPPDPSRPDYPTGGNLISGNGGPGIALSQPGTDANAILGNFIGTNADGTAALPNQGSGVDISDAATNTNTGGRFTGGRNVISGNAQDGIRVSGLADSYITNNLIGVDRTGIAAVPNGGNGIALSGQAFAYVGGAPAIGTGNIVAGNAGDGLTISGLRTFAIVSGNLIGCSADGSSAIPNGSSGLSASGGPVVYLGADLGFPGAENAPEGNIIRGNGTQPGVVASGAATDLRAERNVVINHRAAFEYSGGATGWVHRNDIRQSAESGIQLFDPDTRVSLQRNLISGSGKVPINLGGGAEDGTGRTANDPTDADAGPNDLLNYPTIAIAMQQANGTRVVGSFSGEPGAQLQLDFYGLAATAEDVELWLGSALVMTDGDGDAAFDLTLPTVARAGRRVAATASNLFLTSELSLPVTVSSIDSDGDGLPDDYELAKGLNPMDPADAALDGDGDGQSNLAEYLGGTDPRDSKSGFRTSLAQVSFFELSFPTGVGRSYTIEASDQLATGPWRPLVPVVFGTGGLLTIPLGFPQFSLQFSLIPPRQFYRVRLLH